MLWRTWVLVLFVGTGIGQQRIQAEVRAPQISSIRAGALFPGFKNELAFRVYLEFIHCKKYIYVFFSFHLDQEFNKSLLTGCNCLKDGKTSCFHFIRASVNIVSIIKNQKAHSKIRQSWEINFSRLGTETQKGIGNLLLI